MMLLRRVLRRGKRELQELVAIRRRAAVKSAPRPPRPVLLLDDLPSQTALVVTAHPDDEVIGAGAMLGRLAQVDVICMTDGAPRRGNFARNAGFDNWMDYASARSDEAKAALNLLERRITPMRNLGIADQEAAFNLVPAARHLAGKMKSGITHVITHAYEGGHPDHDSAAFAVHAACALIAKAGGTPPIIVEVPLYNAPNGGVFEHGKFLHHDDAGPVTRFALSPAEQDLKRRMFDCHVTQKLVFTNFNTTEEQFRVAPRYHFCAPPHAGEVGYSQFMGPFTGRVWRGHAWRAMRELDVWEALA